MIPLQRLSLVVPSHPTHCSDSPLCRVCACPCVCNRLCDWIEWELTVNRLLTGLTRCVCFFGNYDCLLSSKKEGHTTFLYNEVVFLHIKETHSNRYISELREAGRPILLPFDRAKPAVYLFLDLMLRFI